MRNWESGKVTLPLGKWASFRRGVICSYNEHLLQLLKKAKEAHTKAKKQNPQDIGVWLSSNNYTQVQNLITNTKEDKTLLVFPAKKNLGLLKLAENAHVSFLNVSIELKNETREITWQVTPGNHACEQARNHLIGRTVFHLLNRIRHWPRNSGGRITGNDDRNAANVAFDGGLDYNKDCFGSAKTKTR